MTDIETPGTKDEAPETAAGRSERDERDPIERIGRANFQAVLNILTESPFFYADDDPMKFGCLRRHESRFREFFEKYFGWRLYVDPKMARLIKDQNFNQALRSAQRNHFRLNSRNECLLFLVLLEFYEHECTAQSYSYDDLKPLNFTYAGFLGFARTSLEEHLGASAPDAKEVDVSARQLLKKLQQYRLVRVAEVEEQNNESGFRDMLVEVLPGLNCYEGRKMAESIVDREFSGAGGDDSVEAEETEEENGENL